MIRWIGIAQSPVWLETEYIPEAETYDITSERMSDDCVPHRLAQHAMLWLCQNGLFGELECIYPQRIEAPLGTFAPKLLRQQGVPHLAIDDSHLKVAVQHTDTEFTIWLAEGKTIDHCLDAGNVTFMFAGKELVAVNTKNVIAISNSRSIGDVAEQLRKYKLEA